MGDWSLTSTLRRKLDKKHTFRHFQHFDVYFQQKILTYPTRLYYMCQLSTSVVKLMADSPKNICTVIILLFVVHLQTINKSLLLLYEK